MGGYWDKGKLRMAWMDAEIFRTADAIPHAHNYSGIDVHHTEPLLYKLHSKCSSWLTMDADGVGAVMMHHG